MVESKITFDGMRYQKREDESVLDALRRGGAEIPFSCRKGSCHTCLLQVVKGTPDPVAQAGLTESMVQAGVFKPCVARQCGELELQLPELSSLEREALVEDITQVSESVYRIRLDVGVDLAFLPGQFINIKGPEEQWRSYSITSVREFDYFLELHVKRWADGRVSRWLTGELAAQTSLTFRGPSGNCHFQDSMLKRPLLLVGTGSGGGALLGVARQALLAGHQAGVHFYHGVRDAQALYLADAVRSLSEQYETFSATQCVSGEGSVPDFAVRGRATDIAFEAHTELAEATVFLCGNPDAVFAGRVRAVAAGAGRMNILADPFESSKPHQPTDKQILQGLKPDPELWAALREGAGLSVILEDFYTRAYRDPELAPFFHRVTKQRAIEKQHEFLRDIFCGSKDYFGARPFNAHHWMIISDALFDHREELFLQCLKRYGLEEHLVRRWSAMHELFRRDIVKAEPRGLLVNGVERLMTGYSLEELSVSTLCDGCHAEMSQGSSGHMHRRTGELYCLNCYARVVGDSMRPANLAIEAAS